MSKDIVPPGVPPAEAEKFCREVIIPKATETIKRWMDITKKALEDALTAQGLPFTKEGADEFHARYHAVRAFFKIFPCGDKDV